MKDKVEFPENNTNKLGIYMSWYSYDKSENEKYY